MLYYIYPKLVSKNYRCSWFGHQYVLTQKVNSHFEEFECKHCKSQVTNDSRGNKIMLTEELKEINKTLHYLHIRNEFVSHFYNRQKNRVTN